MDYYDGDFNLIVGSDVPGGAHKVRITTEGHLIDEDGQPMATIAPWPFRVPEGSEGLMEALGEVPSPAEIGGEAGPEYDEEGNPLPEVERVMQEEVPNEEEGTDDGTPEDPVRGGPGGGEDEASGQQQLFTRD